ncbi:MAG: HAMP domain-containing histidine kinase [Deltaproteobacteria bacterium]|nr:HAMP domain-containing histidine kinase [Deltaproteobacteria bacterium]MBK8713858.1 HAMP domain-containing histidine kinase [Deltaproteobacteria bacterium]
MTPSWSWRSLRVRAFAITLLVAVLPLVMVAFASVFESGVGDRMREATALAASEAAADPDALEAIASRHGVRLRRVGPDGRVLAAADRHESGAPSQFGEVFFGPDGAPTLDEFDAELGPLTTRAEVGRAFAGVAEGGCTSSTGGRLLECHAAAPIVRNGRVVAIIHAQDASRRAIRALYDLRYQLIKLTLIIVPCAFVLAWWLGWRMVLPLERLRAQALEQVAALSRGDALELTRKDEFGELTGALNRLITEIRGHARAHEAALADLAHELKNPVAAIRGAAEALQHKPDDADRTRKLADSVARAGERLDRLVHQFLELARAEAGLGDEPREATDLTGMVAGICHSMAEDVRYGGVELHHSIVGDGACIASVVPLGIETAVRNLIDNALSFAKSRVIVEVRCGETIAIAVTDDGPGITDDDLPRVFDRFYSKRHAGHGIGLGSGLGLALVRAIAEAHGGHASVRSKLGAGSTFVIELPRAQPASQ